MKLICRQVSCHNTSLSAREALAFTQDSQKQILEHIGRSNPQIEAMILCTCNRTEIYLYLPAQDDPDKCIEKAVAAAAPKVIRVWKQNRHCLQGRGAIEHLFAVACGLDSQVPGEYQIIRQLKDAYSMSIELRMSRFFFHRLLHAAFRASKEVRSRTSIGSGARSISKLAAKLAGTQISLNGACVLIVGAGENARIAAQYLYKSGPAKMIIASRTLQSAAELAGKFKNASTAALEDVPQLLEKVDMVLCSTASQQPVITAQACAYFIKQRIKPLLMIDIAVPRDIDPQVADLPGVRLVNIDDFDEIVRTDSAAGAAGIDLAADILQRHIRTFVNWLDSLETAGFIARLQQAYLDAAASHTRRYRRYFAPDQHDALERFAKTLAKKLMHAPISYLKDGPDCRHEQAAELLGGIFEHPPAGERDK